MNVTVGTPPAPPLGTAAVPPAPPIGTTAAVPQAPPLATVPKAPPLAPAIGATFAPRRTPGPAPAPAAAEFLTPAFAFRVVFGERLLKNETSFQEVSGIGVQMEVEQVSEGGENRFKYSLPKGMKCEPLVLKRGIAPAGSALVRWCRATLEGALAQQIMIAPLTVYLLDPDLQPLRAWLIADAFPTRWSVGTFDAGRNELAIETITLNYTTCNRIL